MKHLFKKLAVTLLLVVAACNNTPLGVDDESLCPIPLTAYPSTWVFSDSATEYDRYFSSLDSLGYPDYYVKYQTIAEDTITAAGNVITDARIVLKTIYFAGIGIHMEELWAWNEPVLYIFKPEAYLDRNWKPYKAYNFTEISYPVTFGDETTELIRVGATHNYFYDCYVFETAGGKDIICPDVGFVKMNNLQLEAYRTANKGMNDIP